MVIRRNLLFGLLISLALLAAATLWVWKANSARVVDFGDQFDGDRAFEDVRYQVDLGPRLPGSRAHARTIDWIQEELRRAGWDAQAQPARIEGHDITNVVGKKEGAGEGWIILRAVALGDELEAYLRRLRGG